ncbi:hypothetical protein DFJ77DRAFT_467973 [Powellomyces hirtus]|nr:hypothetical protein DFJ77DRAFT_467973 [Powellomyces hirtus]
MADNKRVIITYTYGPDAEENGLGIGFADDLEGRLPLRNVAWQNPLGFSKGNTSPPRVIELLEVELKRYSPEMFPRAMPGTLYHSPYFLHLYLVTTDDSEFYKGTVRKQIQEWLNVVANKKNQEWLIVYLINAESKGKSARFLGVGASSVFDKLKSDFSFKKERCIRMKLQNDPGKDAEAWTDLQNHLKEGIISSLNQQIIQYDEDTRRIDQQRLMPGWNYCQYFIMKEGLAYTFEFMNLIDEALLQYDELEASFFQTLAEQGAPWFAKFGGLEPEDDSANILELQRKPYRDMIMQNKISIFDFRVYLFARQCQLLFRLRHAVEICQRAKVFINQFARTIQENEVSLFPFFREAWVYSACVNVICHCDELVAVSSLQPEILAGYDGEKADLLRCARIQLDKLGVASGTYRDAPGIGIASTHATAPDPESASSAIKDSLQKITNSELRSSLFSAEAFDELYLKVTGRAIRSCQGSKRPRTGRMLSGDIAQLHFCKGRFAEAAAVWEPLQKQFPNESWDVLDDLLAEKLASCWKMLSNQDRYLQSCLHLVACPTIATQRRIKYFVDELIRTSHEASEVLHVENSPLLHLNVKNVINTISDDGQLLIALDVTNRLPEELEFDQILLRLVSSDGIEFYCSMNDIKLGVAKSLIQLSGQKVTISGTYVVDSVTCQIGKLKLIYRDLGSFPITGGAVPFRISADLPDQTWSQDANSTLQIKLFTGSQALKEGCIMITGSTLSFPNIKSMLFRTSSVAETGAHVKECAIDTVENKIMLPAVSSFEQLSFLMPFQESVKAASGDHKVKLSFTYTTLDGKRHIWYETETINLTPAIEVTHAIVYNPVSPIVRYNIVGRRQNPMRIASLNASTSASMDPVLCSNSRVMVLFRNEEFPVVYHLRPKPDAEAGKQSPIAENAKIQLDVAYHDLDKEIEEYFLASLDKLLSERDMTQYSGCLMHYICDMLVPNIDILQYALKDIISLPPLDLPGLHAMLRSERPETINRIEEFLTVFHERLRTSSGGRVRQSQMRSPRMITYQVEVPIAKILLGAEIRPAQSDAVAGYVLLGEPIQCHLTITPQRWDDSSEQVTCLYEIITDSNCWMLSGKKKRKAVLVDKEAALFAFTVIPVRTGYIPLPPVTVEGLQAKAATVYHNNSLGINVRSPTIATKSVIFAT